MYIIFAPLRPQNVSRTPRGPSASSHPRRPGGLPRSSPATAPFPALRTNGTSCAAGQPLCCLSNCESRGGRCWQPDENVALLTFFFFATHSQASSEKKCEKNRERTNSISKIEVSSSANVFFFLYVRSPGASLVRPTAAPGVLGGALSFIHQPLFAMN